MINFEKNSLMLRDFLMTHYDRVFPGCIFYITKNGLPFADGSFGWARMPGSPEGASSMTPNTIIHTGSIGKIFGALSLIRMVEEWNSIHVGLLNNPNAIPSDPNEVPFWNFVSDFGMPLSLDDVMWLLIEPFLDHTLISGYAGTYPGQNVRTVTLRQLINHKSGLSGTYNLSDTGFSDYRQVHFEPADGSPAVFNLKAIATALLRNDATSQPASVNYQGINYILISAIIESVTGRKFTDYAVKRLFNGDTSYSDINRKVTDKSRGARYYQWHSPGTFSGNVLHPDYTDFSADGGWYMSAVQFCKWFDNIMNGGTINNGLFPVVFDLEHESYKEDDFTAFGHGKTGRLKYLNKNGAAAPGGGHTNADFRYYWGYNEERYCVFTAVNAEVNASMLIEQGVNVLKEIMTKRPGGLHLANLNLQSGLLQTVFADRTTLAQMTDSQIKPVTIEGVNISGNNLQRTNLLGAGNTIAGNLTTGNLCMVELRGMLKIEQQGYYKFRLSSDDGSVLWIDDDLIIDLNYSHGLTSRESDRIFLKGAGSSYPVKVEWYNDEGGGSLYLEWVPPNKTDFEAIPVQNFQSGI